MYKTLYKEESNLPYWNNISKFLSKKAISLIEDMNINSHEYSSGESGIALGTTRHGEKGPTINYPNNISIALHELGHAITFPYEQKNGRFNINKEILSLSKLVNLYDSKIKQKINMSNDNEKWADTFRNYFLPMGNIWLKINYPKIFEKMKNYFGKSPTEYNKNISTELKDMIKLMEYDYTHFQFQSLAPDNKKDIRKDLKNRGALTYFDQIDKLFVSLTNKINLNFNSKFSKIEQLIKQGILEK